MADNAQRRLLVGRLPHSLVCSLPLFASPDDQLQSDVQELNRQAREGATFGLLSWLECAIAKCKRRATPVAQKGTRLLQQLHQELSGTETLPLEVTTIIKLASSAHELDSKGIQRLLYDLLGTHASEVRVTKVVEGSTFLAITGSPEATQELRDVLAKGTQTVTSLGTTTAVARGVEDTLLGVPSAAELRRVSRLPDPLNEVLLRLDRSRQRAAADRMVHDLLADREHGLLALVGAGAVGNRIEQLADSLCHHIQHARRDLLMLRRHVRLFPSSSSLKPHDEEAGWQRPELDSAVIRLGELLADAVVAGRRPLIDAIVHSFRAVPRKQEALLWLDWGVYGDRPELMPDCSSGTFELWLEFHRRLAGRIGNHQLAIIAYIGLEKPVEAIADVRVAVEDFTRHDHIGFAASILPQLDVVDALELLEFLRSEDTLHVPDGQDVAIARALMAETNGRYQDLVTAIEAGARTNWAHLIESHSEPRTEEQEPVEEARKMTRLDHASLLKFISKTLEEHVKEVRLSNGLTSSPVRLVNSEGRVGPGNGGQKRILELSHDHPVLGRMQSILEANADDPVLADYARLLYGQALIAEGSSLPDPESFARWVEAAGDDHL